MNGDQVQATDCVTEQDVELPTEAASELSKDGDWDEALNTVSPNLAAAASLEATKEMEEIEREVAAELALESSLEIEASTQASQEAPITEKILDGQENNPHAINPVTSPVTSHPKSKKDRKKELRQRHLMAFGSKNKDVDDAPLAGSAEDDAVFTPESTPKRLPQKGDVGVGVMREMRDRRLSHLLVTPGTSSLDTTHQSKEADNDVEFRATHGPYKVERVLLEFLMIAATGEGLWIPLHRILMTWIANVRAWRLENPRDRLDMSESPEVRQNPRRESMVIGLLQAGARYDANRPAADRKLLKMQASASPPDSPSDSPTTYALNQLKAVGDEDRRLMLPGEPMSMSTPGVTGAAATRKERDPACISCTIMDYGISCGDSRGCVAGQADGAVYVQMPTSPLVPAGAPRAKPSNETDVQCTVM